MIYTSARQDRIASRRKCALGAVLRVSRMAAFGFCSACGARLKIVRRSRVPPFRSLCAYCSQRVPGARWILIGVPLLCASIGFGIGYYTRATEPFYFIGTPVEMTVDRFASGAHHSSDQSSLVHPTLNRPEHPAISTSAVDEVCGAQTKSGKPCRRKVKGGGHCWQHRGITLKK